MSSPVGEIDPVALSRQALLILEQRMVDDPADIPSGQLIALARDLAKIELARLQSLPPEAKVEQTVSDVLSLTSLPRGRRLELLREHDKKLGLEHAKIIAAIQEMEEERGQEGAE